MAEKCDDVQLVALNIDKMVLTFFNVYNDSTEFTALHAIVDSEDSLPALHFVVGDFNLHHEMWDQSVAADRTKKHHVRESNQLVEVMTLQHGLQLVNEEDGPTTWRSNRTDNADYVLDLLWTRPELAPLSFEVSEDKGNSDHCPLVWELPICHRIALRATVKRGSKEGTKGRPCLISMAEKCDDVQLVALNIDKMVLTFLNVYNNSTEFTALHAIADSEDSLPALHFVVGDFNLHHKMWDQWVAADHTKKRHVRKSNQLVEVTTLQHGLQLVNEEDRLTTWRSNRTDNADYVLNSLWTWPELAPLSFEVLEDKRNSDHCPLVWELPICHRIAPWATVKRGSKEGAVMINAMRYLFSSLPEWYTDHEHVERALAQLSVDLQKIWASCAKTPDFTHHFETWWNKECNVAKRKLMGTKAHRKRTKTHLVMLRTAQAAGHGSPDNLREIVRLQTELVDTLVDLHQARTASHRATSRAKQEFFDGKISKLHEKRIWDVVPWIRAQWQQSNMLLRNRHTGQLVHETAEVAEVLADQFTPADPPPIDMTLVDEMPSAP
ncbi:hypothetical protein PHLGIDRAFT_123450 [Phlebiopsis gigantea 11061_1 CR5-6]|uniref:Endonuclease/exonuclease/phosphatase domain-containing protein n=1 Tax=Phlebiopsis gigantea (strain 11061_1 CR5-6) TaxID=745531 RepID=A0A0C3NA38_PHLG1|nr:hypothetical protein PHLGIDRAFT_123450 [Phlebiopsis gigantea 11061_1 CR5-6]